MDTLTRDGVVLAYEDVGQGAPPILLVHDLERDHTSMLPQLARFRRRHRVVAVDLRGHGQSGGRGAACALADHASDLVWLCYELGLYRPIVVGRGAGGAIATALAASWPQLLGGLVAAAGDEADERVNAAIERLLPADAS